MCRDTRYVDALQAELETWKENLPVWAMPTLNNEVAVERLPLSIVLLHLQYNDSMSKLHTIRAFQDHPGSPSLMQMGPMPERLELQTPLPKNASLARITIALMKSIMHDQFTCLW